jgi:hypothetical protein
MRPPTTPSRLPPTSVTTELLDASCACDSAQVQKLIGRCRRSRLPHPPARSSAGAPVGDCWFPCDGAAAVACCGDARRSCSVAQAGASDLLHPAVGDKRRREHGRRLAPHRSAGALCCGGPHACSPANGCQRSAPAKPAWRSRMIVQSTPDASSPGPSGPDRFSPTGGSCRSADLVAADTRLSCHWISSVTASARSGAASPAALAAYAAAPTACAPM